MLRAESDDRVAVPFEPEVRGGRTNGVANKVQWGDRACHEWYRFVLSFPPHLVRQYLDRFKVSPGQLVLDPFCGTGTTLVECKKCGVSSVGIEAHPVAAFASRVKLDWAVSPDHLIRDALAIGGAAKSALLGVGIDDDLGGLRGGVPKGTELNSLPAEAEELLLAGSISQLPLHKTLTLLSAIENRRSRYINHERLALAKALVFSISNLQFGPEVGVGPPKADVPVVAAWLAEIERMAADLRVLKNSKAAGGTVYQADAREPLLMIQPHSVDAVITSPPYPNEKDYTRTTRLESVLLGFVRNRAELRALKERLVRSNTRNVYKGDNEDRWISGHPEVQRIAEAIEARRRELGKTSGFERLYPKVTKLYFGGMARHLANLREVLRPGAQLAYVVGDQASYLRIMIRTGRLLSQIAEQLGYEVLGIDLFRTRLATATREQLREEVVLLRWPGRAAHLTISAGRRSGRG